MYSGNGASIREKATGEVDWPEVKTPADMQAEIARLRKMVVEMRDLRIGDARYIASLEDLAAKRLDKLHELSDLLKDEIDKAAQI